MVGGREGVDEEVQDIFIELDSILFVVFIDKEEEVEQLDRNEEGEWLTNFYFINKEEDLEGGRRKLEDNKVKQTNRFK